jgi:hypothetical protein
VRGPRWPALLLLAASAMPARAHGPGEVPLVLAMVLSPNVGSEVLFGGHRDNEGQLLLSWPFQFPLPREFSRGGDAPHRLVLSPEVTIGRKAEFSGRVGYRWVPKPVFVGIGLSAKGTLGVSGVPEIGIRFWEYNDFNVYLVGRADMPLATGFHGPWAASLSAGFACW